jgi:hypothetical protein
MQAATPKVSISIPDPAPTVAASPTVVPDDPQVLCIGTVCACNDARILTGPAARPNHQICASNYSSCAARPLFLWLNVGVPPEALITHTDVCGR